MGATESGVEPRTKRQPYRCFLLRCRLEEGVGPEGEAAWRFTVEQAGGKVARRSFSSLEDVAAYVEAQLKSCRLSEEAQKSAHSPK